MKSKITAFMFTVLTLLCLGKAHADDWTGSRPILAVLVSGTAYYVVTTGWAANWGSAACPNATHLYILRSDPGSSQLLAALLAIKAAGGTVSAYGNCNVGGPNYFHTNYIIAN